MCVFPVRQLQRAATAVPLDRLKKLPESSKKAKQLAAMAAVKDATYERDRLERTR